MISASSLNKGPARKTPAQMFSYMRRMLKKKHNADFEFYESVGLVQVPSGLCFEGSVAVKINDLSRHGHSHKYKALKYGIFWHCRLTSLTINALNAMTSANSRHCLLQV